MLRNAENILMAAWEGGQTRTPSNRTKPSQWEGWKKEEEMAGCKDNLL